MTRPAREPVDGGPVRILEWPREMQALEALAGGTTPRLLLVDEGSEPPVGGDCCQDWMWKTGEEREMRMRIWQLSLRSLAHGHERPRIDDIGMLHVGLRSVHLAPRERAIAAVLLEQFNDVVPAGHLVAAVWPDGISGANALASRVSALRSKVAWIGLEVRGSSTKGYTLCATDVTVPGDDPPGFEDELDAARRLGR